MKANLAAKSWQGIIATILLGLASAYALAQPSPTTAPYSGSVSPANLAALVEQFQRPAKPLGDKQKLELEKTLALYLSALDAAPADRLTALQNVIDNVIGPETSKLQYWGDDAKMREGIRPIIEAVIPGLDSLDKDAAKQAAQLGTGDNPPQAQIDSLINFSASARYAKFSIYDDWALSLDPKDPKRRQIADDGIKGLAEWDTADSGVQAQVHFQLGLLCMAEQDFPGARKWFDEIQTNKQIQPPPEERLIFDCKYFSAQSDVLAGDPASAQADLAVVNDYRKQTPALAADKRALSQSEMLEYRLDYLFVAQAQDDPTKLRWRQKAAEVMKRLVKDSQ
jgi:hypothetical protein